jgi:hypothetical protein
VFFNQEVLDYVGRLVLRAILEVFSYKFQHTDFSLNILHLGCFELGSFFYFMVLFGMKEFDCIKVVPAAR